MARRPTIGQLDRQALIEKDVGVLDASGAHKPVWQTLGTVWASKREAGGREAFAGGQDMLAFASVAFTIRWRNDVTTAMRLTVETQIYDIQHVAEIGRRRFLELLCKRRSSDQG